MNKQSLDVEQAVKERYSRGAQTAQRELCIPVNYKQNYLKAIPQEIIERDYGCGDPTLYIKPGETVLDLGSGTGKACYIAAQAVGASGKIIGVDMNQDMLALARKYQEQIAKALGYANVQFHKAKIQNLALDIERVEKYLEQNPIRNYADLQRLESLQAQWRQTEPLIPSESIDVVISNCVLNLVREEDKKLMFAEIYRVLKRGGRIAISDIVCDEEVPDAMKNDKELWSGCISGALQESKFLNAFAEVGFYGMQIAQRMEKPWQVVQGIEFRSMTVTAYKGKEGPCLERNQAVLYKGPFKEVLDDDGHRFPRGERVAVCDKTMQIFAKEPYRSHVEIIEPYENIPLSQAKEFPCTHGVVKRHPQATKGKDYQITTSAVGACCEPTSGSDANGSCC